MSQNWSSQFQPFLLEKNFFFANLYPKTILYKWGHFEEVVPTFLPFLKKKSEKYQKLDFNFFVVMRSYERQLFPKNKKIGDKNFLGEQATHEFSWVLNIFIWKTYFLQQTIIIQKKWKILKCELWIKTFFMYKELFKKLKIF